MNLNPEILKICELAHLKHEGHIGSSLSILNILDAVFSYKQTQDIEFVLSKGHASLGLYVILYKYGYISLEELDSFCDFGSRLGGHPDYRKVPGIKFSTGSLGHGLPQSIGLALANRATDDARYTIVLCGDGELNEGSNWEAALLATHHHLSNLKLIVDYNKSSERALSVKKIPDAFSALGWDVSRVGGHNHEQLSQAIKIKSNAPHLIWAETIKGRGVSFMENNPEWHHKVPNEIEIQSIKKELGVA